MLIALILNRNRDIPWIVFPLFTVVYMRILPTEVCNGPYVVFRFYVFSSVLFDSILMMKSSPRPPLSRCPDQIVQITTLFRNHSLPPVVADIPVNCAGGSTLGRPFPHWLPFSVDDDNSSSDSTFFLMSRKIQNEKEPLRPRRGRGFV